MDYKSYIDNETLVLGVIVLLVYLLLNNWLMRKDNDKIKRRVERLG